MTQTPDGPGVAHDAGPVGGAGRPAVPEALAAPQTPVVVPSATAPEPVAEAADAVRALVLAVPGVAALHAGRFGEVATYLPGRRVTGVKLTEDRVEVHVVVEHDAPIRAVAQQIHAVVAAVVTVPVQVFVEDLAAVHAA